MSRKKKKKHEKNCFECDNCQYVGEGGFWCDIHHKIVIEDFTCPTEEYLCCKKESK